jgi:hypothetical protein
MGRNLGLQLRRRDDFSSNRSMAGMNRNAKKYIGRRSNVESVLCFEKH